MTRTFEITRALVGFGSATLMALMAASTSTAQVASGPVTVGGAPIQGGAVIQGTYPSVVPSQCQPQPNTGSVSSSLREIRITFDQVMDVGLFSYPFPNSAGGPVTLQGAQGLMPQVTGNVNWINGNKTLSIPVLLQPNTIYSIPINTPTYFFRATTGLYAQPGFFTFSTASSQQGGAMPIRRTPQAQSGGGVVVNPMLAAGASGGTTAVQATPVAVQPMPANIPAATATPARVAPQTFRRGGMPTGNVVRTPTPTPTPAVKRRG